MEFDRLSGAVIGCAVEVHRNLGPGLLETVYRQCLAYELRAKGLRYQSEKAIPVRYKGILLDGEFRLDLLVEDELVVELKAVEHLLPVHEAQLLTYMRQAGAKVGLLVNFNGRSIRDGLRRFVL